LIDCLRFFLNKGRKLSSLAEQVLVSGGNFLTIAICAHSLPLAEQGKLTYTFASYMALLLMNIGGIFQGAAVRAPAQQRNSYQISLARLQILQALSLSILVCAVWLGAGHVLGWQATAIEVMLLFTFLVVQQLAEFDRRSAYIFSGTKRAIYSSTVLYPFRIIGLFIIRPETVGQVLLILIVSALIPAVLTILVAGRARSESVQSWIKATKAHLKYSLLFIVGAPLGWLWAYIPIFMLGSMHGKEQVALLASIRGISNIANVLMEQVETKVAANWARIQHQNGAQVLEMEVSRLLSIGAIFWFAGMSVIWMFGQEIVVFILGGLYAKHWALLPIGWFAYGIYSLARIFGIKHRTLGSNYVEFVGGIFGAATAVVAGFVLIPVSGAVGAAWVYVIIGIVILITQMLIFRGGRMAAK